MKYTIILGPPDLLEKIAYTYNATDDLCNNALYCLFVCGAFYFKNTKDCFLLYLQSKSGCIDKIIDFR